MAKYHSINFSIAGDRNMYNTYNNWHLIPVSRPVVAQPTPQYNFVDIPGSNKPLDLSEYLTGKIQFSQRTGSFEFYVENDGMNWAARRNQLADFFNGRKMRMVLEDDPTYYYEGRFFFKDWKADSGTNHSMVTIEYQVLPYKQTANGQESGL